MRIWVHLVCSVLMGTMGISAQLVSIGRVQGPSPEDAAAAAFRSPMAGEIVEVEGLVHQRLQWKDSQGEIHHAIGLQNRPAESDRDPRTSDGILVYLGQVRAPGSPLAAGDWVRLGGRVTERFGQTEIAEVEFRERREGGRSRLNELEIKDVNPPADHAAAAAYWERLEGMRVRLRGGALVTGATQVYGEGEDAQIWVVPEGQPLIGRFPDFHRRVFRDVHPLDDHPELGFDNGNGFRIQLNSFGLGAHSAGRLRLLPPLPVGAVLGQSLDGMVLYGYRQYRIAVEQMPRVSQRGPDHRKNHGPGPTGSSFRIATYNVENLYDHRDDPGDPCDAHGNPGLGGIRPPFNYLPSGEADYRERLGRIAEGIFNSLGAPGILLLQEVEAQDLSGKGGNDILDDLGDSIPSSGGWRYRAIAHPKGADERGITCGFLYREDQCELIDLRTLDLFQTMMKRVSPRFQIEFGTEESKGVASIQGTYQDPNGGSSFVFSRPCQILGVRIKDRPDRPLFLLNNHFSSRPDRRVLQRREQARANAAIVAGLLSIDPEAWIVVGGDLNVYPRPDDPFPEKRSDQLASLYEVGLINLYDKLLAEAPQSAYTYVYQGQAQVLDHLFLSPSLARTRHSVSVAHLNADWPVSSNYPWKVSDHDPVLVDLW